MSIKYYRLAKDEEPPEEFCAVRDVNGEPSEYTWYERVSEFYRDLWVPFAQSDWFAGSEYRKLQAENAKLREQLAKARDPQRIGGTADPESFVYAIEQLREFRWQHATNDEDAIPYINNVAAAHERENAKLRKLVHELWDGYADPPCDDCPLKDNPACVDCPICAREAEVIDRMRELGVEVDG